jgi:poly-gamma-glutamate synthesis protein (capsule biosynthesis protein)
MLTLRRFLIFLTLLLLYTKNSSAQEKVTFCAVGDVLFDRGVRTMIEKKGVDYPFEKVAEFINQYDLAFCNLECPISKRGDPLAKICTFRGDSSFVEGLKKSGFNIFCLANNHTLDYGRNALLDTKEILERNGFYTVGAGTNQKEASKGKIIKKKGMTFAFLAYVTMPLEGITYSDSLPGPAQSDIDEIIEEIRNIRETVDFIIISFHWGTEFAQFPSDIQKEYAHQVINNGADLVIGHHPHVIQSIEKYEGKFIIYSLGNFVFDQHKVVRRESIIFGCTFENKRIVFSYIVPVLLEKFRPDFATDKDYERIMKKIETISKGYKVKFTENEGILFLE